MQPNNRFPVTFRGEMKMSFFKEVDCSQFTDDGPKKKQKIREESWRLAEEAKRVEEGVRGEKRRGEKEGQDASSAAFNGPIRDKRGNIVNASVP